MSFSTGRETLPVIDLSLPPPVSAMDGDFDRSFSSIIPPGAGEAAWKYHRLYTEPETLRRFAQTPQVASFLQLNQDPQMGLEALVNRGFLANETGIPAQYMEGTVYETLKQVYAQDRFGGMPGEHQPDGVFFRKISDEKTLALQPRDPSESLYPTKRDIVAQVEKAAPPGEGPMYKTLAIAALARILTPDDPITVERMRDAEGKVSHSYWVWHPRGVVRTFDYGEAQAAFREVQDALLAGKEPPDAFVLDPEEIGLGRRRDMSEEIDPAEAPPRAVLTLPPIESPSPVSDGVHEAMNDGTFIDPAVEAGARFLRGGSRSLVDTKMGIDLWFRELGRDSVNPYVEKTVAEAKADLERLNGEIDVLEQDEAEFRKQNRRRYPIAPRPETARLAALRRQRDLAELASRGITPENFMGSLYRSAQDEIASNMELRQEVQQMFSDKIKAENDDALGMQVFEGLGEGMFTLIATIGLRPLAVGVSQMQNQGRAYVEYMEAAEDRGLSLDEETAFAYARDQGLAGAAWDVAGNVVNIKAFRGAMGPGTLSSQAANLGKGAAENAVLGTGQTLTEQELAERAGVREETTWEEKGQMAVDAATVSAATTGVIAAGGAVAGGVKRGLSGDGGGHPEAKNGGEPAETSVETRREGDGRRPTVGEHGAQVRAWVGEIQSGWKSKLDVVVHDSADSIGDVRLREAVAEDGANVEAFYDSQDGWIHLLADRVGSKADAERLIRHEGVHWALRGPMKKEYARVLEQIGRSIRWEDLQETIAKYPKGTPDLWIEEHLAKIGETNPQSPVWKRAVAAMRQILRSRFGADIVFSDNDIKAFLTRANRRLEQARESDSAYHDKESGSDDLLFAKNKKKQGQDRKSWSEVRKGDNWNSVKWLFAEAKEKMEPPVFPNHGGKDEIVDAVVGFLKSNMIVSDWTGRTVYLPYTESNGGYRDHLKNRAEHLIASEGQKGTHIRTLDREKVKWVAAIPGTIREGVVRISDGSEVLYLRNYNGFVHIVVTGQEGVLVKHVVHDPISRKEVDATMKIDSGLVSQYPLNLREKRYRTSDPKVEAVRILSKASPEKN